MQFFPLPPNREAKTLSGGGKNLDPPNRAVLQERFHVAVEIITVHIISLDVPEL